MFSSWPGAPLPSRGQGQWAVTPSRVVSFPCRAEWERGALLLTENWLASMPANVTCFLSTRRGEGWVPQGTQPGGRTRALSVCPSHPCICTHTPQTALSGGGRGLAGARGKLRQSEACAFSGSISPAVIRKVSARFRAHTAPAETPSPPLRCAHPELQHPELRVRQLSFQGRFCLCRMIF